MSARRLAWGLVAGLAVIASGCTVQHAPVRTAGDGTALAGVWEGTYESDDTGRTGDLYFALSADADSAVGEVVMVPRGAVVSVRRDEADGAWRWRGVARPQVLTIRFVRLGRRSVEGELDPYRDPDCGCTLRTTFRGEVDGDRVTGTFASTAADRTHGAEGTWAAVRRP